MDNKKTVNIENYQIDQDTEYAVESILQKSKSDGVFDKTPLKNFLAGGNVIRFLSQCEYLAMDILEKTKNPRIKWTTKSNLKTISNFRTKQLNHFAETGFYLRFPAHKGKVLSAHLKV